jgi:predicted nucleic acid-binding protein
VILVDTSVLIDFFKGVNNGTTALLEQIIDNRIPFGINEYIYQEILQGSLNETEFQTLKEYLETLPFYPLLYQKESFERAARMNMLCRQAGITIRSSIDLLIAETALENDLLLLHNDRDFTAMAEVFPDLRFYGGI